MGTRVRPAAARQDQQRPLVGRRQRRLQRRQRERARIPVRDRRRKRHPGRQDRHRRRHRREPDGLSAAGAVRSINGDGVADYAYAGDLDGNLWKFDLFSTTPGSWALSNGGVPLFSAGAGHAITGRPDVTKFTAGGLLVAFGTGRYVASADNTDLTTQRIYAVRDTGSAGTVALASLQQQSFSGTTGTGADGNVYRFSTHAVGVPKDYSGAGDNTIVKSTYLSDKRGWYLDLPESGERVVADARFRGGRAIFTSLVPDVTSPCAYGGSGWVLEFDAMTGNRFGSATFDSNGDNVLTASDYISRSGLASQAMNTSGRRIGAIPAAPGFMSNPAGGVSGLEDKFINTSDGSVVRVRETSGAGREGRVMWHEVRTMDPFLFRRRARAAALGLVAAGLLPVAMVASASRVGGAPAPTASAVQGATQQPAHVQADESASLRQGTVGAIDARAMPVQVQGIWIDWVAGSTQLLRNGHAAGFDTLKAGEPIRFTVVSKSGAAPAMKVIYAP